MEIQKGDLIFFYGTLRRNPARTGLTHMGEATLPNHKLLNIGSFPAIVPTNTERKVKGDVYRIDDPELVTGSLDRYEGYRPSDPENSLYLRQQITVFKPNQDTAFLAWAYVWNGDHNYPIIESGDWFDRGTEHVTFG